MKKEDKFFAVFALASIVFIASAVLVFACGNGTVQCSTDSDCGTSTCSNNFEDFCDGNRLVDYNGNGILDCFTFENFCQNTCVDGFCNQCTPDCSATATAKCVKDVCGAECDSESKCDPKIADNTCLFNDQCNDCTCSYSGNQFCPEPGTISDGICYYGERSCSNSGCGLNQAPMDGFDVCNPSTGPETPPTPPQPEPPSQSSGISIGSGFSGSIYCTPSWECGLWEDCNPNGTQTRECTDLNYCGNRTTEPATVQNCTYTAPPTCSENWLCTDWSDCENGTQTRTCNDLNGCNTTASKPAETQECQVPGEFTGLVTGFFLNPVNAFLILLLIIAILTYIWKRMIPKEPKKQNSEKK